tara:strand:+ start:372 stop:836 length:465 start_codon:yes stop_codon:yes gene_type:complete
MAVSLGPGGLTLDNFTIEDDAPNVIVQVKFADLTGSSNFSTSSSSFTDTGLSLSITPQSSSNKIFVLFHGEGGQTASGRSCFYRVLRGSTEIGLNDNLQTGTTFSQMPLVVTQLDSPATTSATTYKVQMRTDGVGSVLMIASNRSHITLFEVAV